MTHKIVVSDNSTNTPYNFEGAEWRIRSDGNLEVYEVNADSSQTSIAVFKNWDSVVRQVVVNVIPEPQEETSDAPTPSTTTPIRKTRGTK